jgi:hypothetical protein
MAYRVRFERWQRWRGSLWLRLRCWLKIDALQKQVRPLFERLEFLFGFLPTSAFLMQRLMRHHLSAPRRSGRWFSVVSLRWRDSAVINCRRFFRRSFDNFWLQDCGSVAVSVHQRLIFCAQFLNHVGICPRRCPSHYCMPCCGDAICGGLSICCCV